ncbi:hypothetical protein D3C86_2115380 [compost metagenome]
MNDAGWLKLAIVINRSHTFVDQLLKQRGIVAHVGGIKEMAVKDKRIAWFIRNVFGLKQSNG